MIWQNQFHPLLVCQSPFHQCEIQVHITAINLVTHDGMTDVREVDADLVFATRARQKAEEREIPPTRPVARPRSIRWGEGRGQGQLTHKTPLRRILRLRRRSIHAHAILDCHDALLVFAKRRVDQSVFLANMTVNEGDVFLLHNARLPKFPQLTRHHSRLRHESHAARLTI